MYYLSQEIEAWYIIPAIRRSISLCLNKDYNHSYEKIGKILGISKAAISQYAKGKRASRIVLPKQLNKKIMSSCKLLSNNKSNSSEEIQKLISFIQEKSLSCHICPPTKDKILEECKEIKYVNGNYQQKK